MWNYSDWDQWQLIAVSSGACWAVAPPGDWTHSDHQTRCSQRPSCLFRLRLPSSTQCLRVSSASRPSGPGKFRWLLVSRVAAIYVCGIGVVWHGGRSAQPQTSFRAPVRTRRSARPEWLERSSSLISWNWPAMNHWQSTAQRGGDAISPTTDQYRRRRLVVPIPPDNILLRRQ